MIKILISLILAVSLLVSPFAIQAQTPAPNPIVIVPGIMGSWNWDTMLNGVFSDSWDFFALDHTFDNLLQALEDEGYVRDENLFVAFYDWRQGIATSSVVYLSPAINRALFRSNSEKVDLIAYSMGGLLARSYIQSNSYLDNVDKLVLLGAPNLGSSDVYSLWEGGLVPKNWTSSQKYPINFYLWYMTTATGQTADFYDTVRQHIPSVGELLPTYDYLVDSATGEMKPTDEMVEQNPFLNGLNSEDELLDFLLNGPGYTTVVAGTGESTVNTIPVIPFSAPDPEDEKLWKDGIPEPNPPARSDTAGDNRVMLSSAFLPDVPPPIIIFYNNLPPWLRWIAKIVPPARAQQMGWWDNVLSQLSIESKHADLPTKGIDRVFGALGLADPLEWTPIPEPSELFSIWVASPVEVEVTAPDGKTISKDANTIPGAIYDGESDPLGVKMIIIPDPLDGNYSVNLTGLADGGYHIAASYFTDATDTINTADGTASAGEQINYEVILNSSSPESPITVVAPESEPEPEPEEENIYDMLIAIMDSIKKYYEDGLIKDEKTSRYITKCLGATSKIFEKLEKKLDKEKHGSKRHKKTAKTFERVIISHLQKCIAKVKRFQRGNHIDTQTAEAVIQDIKNIIEKTKENQ
jgi:pimeloyl-ACP methyl ester carboxylesterase